jgi:hypothetical protein
MPLAAMPSSAMVITASRTCWRLLGDAMLATNRELDLAFKDESVE